MNGGRRRRVPVVVVTAVVALSAAALAAWAWKGWHADVVGGIASAVSLAAGVTAAWVQWASFQAMKPPRTLVAAAQELAAVVRAELDAEAGRQETDAPWRLPVGFSGGDVAVLGVDWRDLERAARAARSPFARRLSRIRGPHELTGTLDDITRTFTRIPTARLVILGAPGAGKTTLAAHLARQLLDERRGDGPVPVVLGLASWNPEEQPLTQWIAGRLRLSYSGLGAPYAEREGVSLAQALVENQMILPVLDGFDELDPAVRGFGIAAINEALRPGSPLVLTSRTGEYASAVDPEGDRLPVRLRGAAVVQLQDLPTDLMIDYLRAGAAGAVSAQRWEPVFERLRDSADAPVTEALRTPLMLALARFLYNPVPRRVRDDTVLADPAELLDAERFPTAERIQNHLLGGFLAAAYRRPAGTNRRMRGERDAEHAREALSTLAAELDLRRTHDLAWWHLQRAIDDPRSFDRWFVAVVTYVVVLAFDGPVYALFMAAVAFFIARSRRTRAIVPTVLADGQPRRVVLRPPTAASLRVNLRMAVTGGLQLGLGVGLALGVLTGWTDGWRAGWERGWHAALLAGTLIAFANWMSGPLRVMLSFDAPADIALATPRRALVWDRRLALLQASEGALSGTLMGMALQIIPAHGLPLGITVGSVALLNSAWGRFVLARVWWRVERGTPLRLLAFLEDAQQRNVLRQVGPLFQFRHALLQERLRPALTGHAASIIAMAFLPDGRHVVAGGRTERALIWDVADRTAPVVTASVVHEPEGRITTVIDSLAVSQDGRLLAAGTWTWNIGLFDLSDPARPQHLSTTARAHEDLVAGLAFSPDGTVLASASVDTNVHLWSVTDAGATERLATLGAHEQAVRSVAFHPDGSLLATGGRDGLVLLWDVRDVERPRLVHRLAAQVDWVFSMAFDPSGTVLAVGGRQAVSLWGVDGEPAPLSRMPIHAAYTAAFDSTGDLLATGSLAGGANIWDVTDPAAPSVRVRVPAASPAASAAFHPTEDFIALGELDGTFRIVTWTSA
ncbi:NACHT domain-containing protein [Nonomuraea sp. NPDC005501]|uniref:NACHT and WD40 repeat domain-containing protein n=1 Tax=Nonomuraea sp. NPDC005501 TaxID=3156884 RepID=UPI0033AAC4AE